MGRLLIIVLLAAASTACSSPEATRALGGGPGADTGNRGSVVRMHEGSQPYAKTPRIIGAEHVALDSARQAHQLSTQ